MVCWLIPYIFSWSSLPHEPRPCVELQTILGFCCFLCFFSKFPIITLTAFFFSQTFYLMVSKPIPGLNTCICWSTDIPLILLLERLDWKKLILWADVVLDVLRSGVSLLICFVHGHENQFKVAFYVFLLIDILCPY